MASTIDINLALEIKDAVKQVGAFTKEAVAGVDKINSAFSGIKSTLVGVFSIAAIKTFIGASLEQEEAVQKLNAALRNSDSFTKETSEGFQALAEELSKNSGIADEVILSNIAMAKTLGASNAQAQELVTTGIKLSKALGTDLDTALLQLRKSFQGPNKELDKLIPGLQGLTLEQRRSGKAIEVVNGHLAHFHLETDAVTFIVKQFKVALSEAAEAIGDLFTKSGAFSGILKDLIKDLQIFTDLLKGNVSIISGITAIFVSIGASSLTIIAGISDAFAKFFSEIEQGLRKVLGPAAFGVTDALRDAAKTTRAAADSARESIKSLVPESNKAAQAIAKIGKGGASKLGITADFEEIRREAAKNFDSVKNGLKGIGLTERDNIKVALAERIKAIDDGVKFAGKSAEEAAALRVKAELEADKKLKELRRKELQNLAANPFTGAFGFDVDKGIFSDLSEEVQNAVARGLGGLSFLAQGAAGVTKAFGAAAAAIGGPLGKEFGQLIEFLGTGAENVKKQINEFFREIPKVLTNIVQAIPALVVTLIRNIAPLIQTLITEFVPALVTAIVEGLPEIFLAIQELLPQLIITLADSVPILVQRLVDNMPTIVQALAQGMIQSVAPAFASQMPFAAVRLASSLSSSAPQIAVAFVSALVAEAPRFVTELVNQVKAQFAGIAGGAGGGARGAANVASGGLLNTVGKAFGFAEGGRIPDIQKFENDGALIRANAGEQILSKDLSSKLENFLQGGGQQQQTPQPLTVNLRVGEAELAKVILNLNRQGFRVTA